MLQRQQMVDTLNAMNDQLKLQRESLDHEREQFQHELQAQIVRSDPHLLIIPCGNDGTVHNFKIKNDGATAQRIKISYRIEGVSTGAIEAGQPSFSPVPFGAGESKPFSIYIPAVNATILRGGYMAHLTIRAERVDRLISEFTYYAENSMEFVLVSVKRAEESLAF